MMDGPRLPPRAGKPDSLVVLLHGYGSNGADLAALAPGFATALPQTLFLSPNAPSPSPNPGGFQWFPLARLDPRETDTGAEVAAAALDRFLDRELERYALAGDRLALVGFSQGAMMALHVGLRRPAIGAIVAFSGLLPNSGGLPPARAGEPPILLIHGERDEVIPVGVMFAAGQALCASGRGVLWRMSPGLGHGIGPDEVAHAREFLSRALAGRLR